MSFNNYLSTSYSATQGGSGSLSIRDDNFFANMIDRDDYFTVNPSKLLKGVYISVNGELQRYDGDTWIDVTPIVEGRSGEDAPMLLIQYSANGATGWSETINTSLHKYWRWATDGGITWSPNGVRYSAASTANGVPDPYSLQVGGDGKLQLLKDGLLIQEQDETGSWISNSVRTGTGSLHLGELHSFGSGGENTVTVNSDSNIAYYPAWSGVSTDGSTRVNMSARVHSEVLLEEANGALSTPIVDYNYNYTSSTDLVFYYLDIIPAENYTGRLRWTVVKSTGKEAAAFFFDVNATSGNEVVVPFKYPLWAKAGQQFALSITKEDGSYLKVKAGTINPSEPWRRNHYATFIDHAVYHQGNNTEVVSGLSSLTGVDRLPASAIRDFPIMAPTVKGMAKLGATMSINGSGELNTAISPTGIKIVADEAARLSIPIAGGAILAIQQDSGFTYGIEAGEDTSVVGNWKQIGTVATDVVSFNGRNGAVVSEAGDYNMDQIEIADQTTPVKYVFRVESGVPYIEEIA